jgi:hypothetical protein
MPSLSSFISSNQYNREIISVPFVGAMRTGTGYRAPQFNADGVCFDPGGLFGWLIYARTAFTPAKGLTTDTFVAYTNPSDLVQDLNRLGGVTNALLYPNLSGGTWSFFKTADSTTVSPTEIGNQFLNAISYLAYGGTLVLAGQVAGFNKYLQDNPTSAFDIAIDPIIDSNMVSWVTSQEYITGIFPSRPDATGVSGAGYTMANFAATIGSLANGMTQGIKYFSVLGLTTRTIDVPLLQANSKITYTVPSTSDVAGFFARSKNRNELYLTVAGLDRSTVLNGDVINPINWSNPLKNNLRSNKVNFFVNANEKFLGADLVGATAAANGIITVDDRIGPAKLKLAIMQAINNVAFKYVFNINNATTRDQVTSEIQTAIDPFNPYLDTTKTEIVCNGTNNEDNSSTLNIDVVAKPIIGTESFLLEFSYTQ